MSAPKKTAVNLIAGPLGVGKTTAINHLLSLRPEGERWAVLVNEYGLVGLDGALLEPTPDQPKGVSIREIVGGCICCSAGMMFDVSLVLLLKDHPDRLLIEPTGLAALAGVQDTLSRPGICEAIDLRSMICLLDPGRLQRALERAEVQDQVDAADVLLATRPDFASMDELDAFRAWADGLFPKKRLVGEVEQGRLPLEWLDIVREREAASREGYRHGTDHAANPEDAKRSFARRGVAETCSGQSPPAATFSDRRPAEPHEHDHGHGHEHDHGHEHAAACEVHAHDAQGPIVQRVHRSEEVSTVGWICEPRFLFDAMRLSSWIAELKSQARRVKAVLRTNMGWRALNIIDGQVEDRASAYRRDSRLELVIEGPPPDEAALDAALRACLVEQD